MNLINIIDKIYESKNFTNVFLVTIFVLALLFIAVLILGLKDSKKQKNPKKEINEEEVKDVTFKLPTEQEKEEIKEDVTFELPVLTDDLENFKKNLEEEIKKDEEVKVTKNTNTKELEVATRPIKILDINEIEDTTTINTEEVQKIKKEQVKTQPRKEEVKKETKKDKDSVKESKYNSKDNF